MNSNKNNKYTTHLSCLPLRITEFRRHDLRIATAGWMPSRSTLWHYFLQSSQKNFNSISLRKLISSLPLAFNSHHHPRQTYERWTNFRFPLYWFFDRDQHSCWVLCSSFQMHLLFFLTGNTQKKLPPRIAFSKTMTDDKMCTTAEKRNRLFYYRFQSSRAVFDTITWFYSFGRGLPFLRKLNFVLLWCCWRLACFFAFACAHNEALVRSDNKFHEEWTCGTYGLEKREQCEKQRKKIFWIMINNRLNTIGGHNKIL